MHVIVRARPRLQAFDSGRHASIENLAADAGPEVIRQHLRLAIAVCYKCSARNSSALLGDRSPGATSNTV
jgi:hypothetical protein